MARHDVGVLLVLAAAMLHGAPNRLRYAMEPDEVLTRAALCQPTAAIPHPCRRLRGRRAGATPWRGHGRP